MENFINNNIIFLILLSANIISIFLYPFILNSKTKELKQIIFQQEKTIKNLQNQLKNDQYDNDKLIEEFKFTTRQIEIIKLVKERKNNKEIGDELFISENTVKYHLKSIYSTLNIKNRWELKEILT